MANLTQADIAKLQARRRTIHDQLNSMTTSTVGGNANSRIPGGVDHDAYTKRLYWELEQVERLINAYDDAINAADEIINYGV